MPWAELLADYVPPVLAVAAILAALLIRLLRHRHDSTEEHQRSEWDRMRDLLSDVERDRDRLDSQVSDLVEDNARLRRDLAEALRRIDHRHEE